MAAWTDGSVLPFGNEDRTVFIRTRPAQHCIEAYMQRHDEQRARMVGIFNEGCTQEQVMAALADEYTMLEVRGVA
jgi:hypothetical protein